MLSPRAASAAALALATTASAPVAAAEKNALKGLAWTNALQFLNSASPDALAGALRGYLVHNLPPVIYDRSSGWGHTSKVTTGVTWNGSGPLGRPGLHRGDRKDGTWRHLRVVADNLADTLILDIRNVQRPEAGKLLFETFLSWENRVDYHQQRWLAGIRLYDTSVRARCRVKVLLQCQVAARLESTGALLPDAVIRFQVNHANLQVDHWNVEHAAGLGGEAAKLLGDAVRGGVRQWDPNFEPHLIQKASAAMVRATEAKEVRFSLSKLLAIKNMTPGK